LILDIRFYSNGLLISPDSSKYPFLLPSSASGNKKTSGDKKGTSYSRKMDYKNAQTIRSKKPHKGKKNNPKFQLNFRATHF
jgi:hypothetical protein